jgi:hypothetical protein
MEGSLGIEPRSDAPKASGLPLTELPSKFQRNSTHAARAHYRTVVHVFLKPLPFDSRFLHQPAMIGSHLAEVDVAWFDRRSEKFLFHAAILGAASEN